MHIFTALFDKRADAEAVQARLEQLGIVDIDHGLHGSDSPAISAGTGSGNAKVSWGAGNGAAPPAEDRHIYEEAVRRGGFLLTVNVDDQEAAQVAKLLEGSNAVDFDERERELKQSGYVGQTLDRPSDDAIALVEEKLLVGKRQVERGGVRVRSYTVETPVHQQVELRQEHVDVERRPVNARVDDSEALFQERSFEVTETAEEVVIGKEARVVEEISLRKGVEDRTETISDTVRRTEVEVTRVEPKPPLSR